MVLLVASSEDTTCLQTHWCLQKTLVYTHPDRSVSFVRSSRRHLWSTRGRLRQGCDRWTAIVIFGVQLPSQSVSTGMKDGQRSDPES